ncbi:MAG TPA: ABC transporter substrate-binding protein [Casimicrobiaceae bacterium]|nr:ABC transporter substrate-binding protein [Casimicrobiaceae bacterium]
MQCPVVGFIRRMFAALLACAALTLLVAPCATAQQPLKKITIALGGDGLHISAIHIPIAKGYFREEGLEVELVDVNSGPRQVAAIMGGSALFGPLGLIQVIKANAEGGSLAAAANLFGILDLHVVLSKDAAAKSGITNAMPVDERIRRMKGLRIGITSPGSTTDTMARTLFKARGMDPDQTVQLQPLGGGSNMLAALEKGATDGFVWSAPQPQIAVAKGIGVIVIDPFERIVPEVIDVPYEVMAINMATAKQNEDVIRRSIRALTKGMKFTQEHPDEALKIMQAHFPNFDQEVLSKVWPKYVSGLPKSPVIPKAYFDNTQRWLNVTAKTPVNTKYEEVVKNDVAAQTAKELLGQ